MSKSRSLGYKNFVKSLFDRILGVILIFSLIPLFVVISIMNLAFGLPILFFHERPGQGGEIFSLIKFCTIHPKSKKMGNWSYFLRKSSLDELPQLLNIIRGEMSFIGPRPLLIEYLDIYNREQVHRHDAKPGITGLAQVNGRNALSFDDKIKYDLEYVKNITLKIDLQILFKTVLQLFKFHQADGHIEKDKALPKSISC